MHKDPPPTLFDARRPLAHVITHGLLAGFLLAIVTHFGWSLWRQSKNGGGDHASGADALVNGIDVQEAPPTSSPPGR